MKKYTLLVAAVAAITLLSGWGFLVHRTTQQLAIYQLPKPLGLFFYKNMDYLVKEAVRPDLRRNEDKTEAPKHFIDIEAYGDSAAWKMPLNGDEAIAKYSEDTLKKYGYVPYHVIVMKNKLTAAFKKMDKDSILFFATDLGHYIEDAHVPLHTSMNYDGQLSNQKGLHNLWESTVPELDINSYQLFDRRRAKYIAHPEEEIWKAVRESYRLLSGVYGTETMLTPYFVDSVKYRTQMRRGKPSKSYSTAFAKEYGAALKASINAQLLSSAQMVADFWYTAWIDAGKPDLSSVNNDFTKAKKKMWRIERKSFRHNHLIQDNLLITKKIKDPEF